MIKTATVTFHASHNYGSSLQAYALQQTIVSLGYENQIINLRTARQRDSYTVFTKRKGIKYILKNITHFFYYFPLKRSYYRFEDFITNKLLLTKEFSTEEELIKQEFNFDCFIAGSDQIWNPVPEDFDWSYYLTFVKKGRKISYAPSFGPLSSIGDSTIQKKIAENLKTFDSISVREQGSADNVKKLTGINPRIVLDPTLLLNRESWLQLIESRKKIIKEDYIFFYTLFADPERMRIVRKISEKTGLPIVVSHFSNQYDFFNGFIKHYDAGPLEFLTLIRDAKLVVASSFHGTVFSILLNVPFFAINGLKDARINTLLQLTGLTSRSIGIEDVDDKCNNAYTIDFDNANDRLIKERETCLSYLSNSIEND